MSKETTFATAKTAEPPPAKRMKSLDGLRGTAVLLVIAFHTLRVIGHDGYVGRAVSRLQESAWVGVDLFFVLSGFLITGILLDTRSCENYFRTFFARRTLRIFPLYYAVLTVAIIVVPVVCGPARLPELYSRLIENQHWLWLYSANYLQATGAHTLPGFGHFWSLAIEEQFYWFWPVVVYFCSRRRLFQVCVAVCLLSPLFRLILIEFCGVLEWGVRQYTFTRLDALLVGALVSLLVRERNLVRRFHSYFVAAIGLSFAALVVMAARRHYLEYEAPEIVILGYSCLGILFAALIYHLATTQTKAERVLSAPVLRWFGRYSYGIYIFHWPIAQAYRATIEPKLAKFLGFAFLPAETAFLSVTAVSALVACLSWHLFEVRFLRLKEHFTYSSSVRATPLRPVEAELPAITGLAN